MEKKHNFYVMKEAACEMCMQAARHNFHVRFCMGGVGVLLQVLEWAVIQVFACDGCQVW